MKAVILITVIALAVPAGALAQQPPPASELPATVTPSRPPEGQPPGAEEFVEQMASSILFGIELARLAQQRSNTPRIKGLTDKVIEIERKAQNELQSASREQGIRLQANLTATQAQKLRALKEAPDDQIDTVYLSARMAAAQKQMSLLSLYASKGDAGALKHYALSEFQQVRANFLEAHEMSGK